MMGDTSTWSPNVTQGTEVPPVTEPDWRYLWLTSIPVLSLIANVMVVVTVSRTIELQHLFYYFLASMSTIHILQILLVVPLALARIVIGKFPLGLGWCRGWQVLQVTLLGCTPVHLLLAVFNCFFLVHFPLQYKKIEGRRYSQIQVAGAWILSIALAVPFMVNISREDSNIPSIFFPGCSLVLPHYVLTAFLPNFFVPLAFLVVMCVITVQTVRKKGMAAIAMQKSNPESMMNGSVMNGTVPKNKTDHMSKQSYESALMDTIEVLTEEYNKKAKHRPNGIVRQYSMCEDEPPDMSIIPQKLSTDDSQEDTSMKQVITTAEVHIDDQTDTRLDTFQDHFSEVDETVKQDRDSAGTSSTPQKDVICKKTGSNIEEGHNQVLVGSSSSVESSSTEFISSGTSIDSTTTQSTYQDSPTSSVDILNEDPKSNKETKEHHMDDVQSMDSSYSEAVPTRVEPHEDGANIQAQTGNEPREQKLSHCTETETITPEGSSKEINNNKEKESVNDGEIGQSLSKCLYGREQLNEPLDEEHIQITMETKGLLPDLVLPDQPELNGLENPAFETDSEDENPLADSIMVKRLPINEPQETTEYEENVNEKEEVKEEAKEENETSVQNGHAGMASLHHSRASSQDMGSPVTSCRSILRRDGSKHPNGKSVKFATLVMDNEGKTDRGPKLRRKGSKAKPNKLNVQNGALPNSKKITQKQTKQNGSVTSNTALEYLVKSRQNPGERLLLRTHTHKTYLKGLVSMLICYVLLVTPYVTLFTVSAACSTCWTQVQTLVVLVCEWLLYGSTIAYPLTYLAVFAEFRHACFSSSTREVISTAEEQNGVPDKENDPSVSSETSQH